MNYIIVISSYNFKTLTPISPSYWYCSGLVIFICKREMFCSFISNLNIKIEISNILIVASIVLNLSLDVICFPLTLSIVLVVLVHSFSITQSEKFRLTLIFVVNFNFSVIWLTSVTFTDSTHLCLTIFNHKLDINIYISTCKRNIWLVEFKADTPLCGLSFLLERLYYPLVFFIWQGYLTILAK